MKKMVPINDTFFFLVYFVRKCSMLQNTWSPVFGCTTLKGCGLTHTTTNYFASWTPNNERPRKRNKT